MIKEILFGIFFIACIIVMANMLDMIPRGLIGRIMTFIRKKARLRRRRARLIINNKVIKELPSYKNKK